MEVEVGGTKNISLEQVTWDCSGRLKNFSFINWTGSIENSMIEISLSEVS